MTYRLYKKAEYVYQIRANYLDPGRQVMADTVITEFEANYEDAKVYFAFFALGQKFPV